MTAPETPLSGEALLAAVTVEMVAFHEPTVERLSGRGVLAFISNQHVGPRRGDRDLHAESMDRGRARQP